MNWAWEQKNWRADKELTVTGSALKKDSAANKGSWKMSPKARGVGGYFYIVNLSRATSCVG